MPTSMNESLPSTKAQGCKPHPTLDALGKVEAYDDAGMAEGHLMVTLAKGWAWSDAAAPGEDPEGRSACHSFSAKNATEARRRVSLADRCYCGRCVS